ncbi:MAG: hypothetical protein R6V02_04760 [Candidatus Aminicenantes bacterium]
MTCPICRSRIWVERHTLDVIKSEKSQKIKESLDELLEKERSKKTQMENKLASTAAMTRERKKQAEDKFSRVFSKLKDSE